MLWWMSSPISSLVLLSSTSPVVPLKYQCSENYDLLDQVVADYKCFIFIDPDGCWASAGGPSWWGAGWSGGCLVLLGVGLFMGMCCLFAAGLSVSGHLCPECQAPSSTVALEVVAWMLVSSIGLHLRLSRL